MTDQIDRTTYHGECNICHQTKKCRMSTDMNGDGDGGQGTGVICPSCARSEGMIPCRLCGDMRYPENTVEVEGRFGRYCVGCADDIEGLNDGEGDE